MMLPIPGVGNESGPQYAFDINSALALVDAHDHSPGKGVQVTPAGLNINANLSFQSNSATLVGSIVFSAVSPPSTLQALYVAPGVESPADQDLWFNDGNGNQVQLTSNGAVNATIASIPGESYAAGTFYWKQGALSTTPANFDIGSITLRPNTPATSNGVQLIPPSTVATTFTFPTYSVTIGGTLPLGLTSVMAVSSGGTVSPVASGTNGQYLGMTGGIPAWTSFPAKAPTQTVFTGGSGTYATPVGAVAIKIRMVGGGGGGASANGSSPINGGNGGDTSFGTYTAGHGFGAAAGAVSGGAGGTVSGSPAIGIAGASGGDGTRMQVTSGAFEPGYNSGAGGSSAFGGAGASIGFRNSGPVAGLSATTNSGSGGSGAANVNYGTYPGGGGGAGAYVEQLISSPSSTYAYGVGSGGAGGTATSGTTGGAGGSGIIIIDEYY